jgi:D-lactate dehydrogenase (cytochrome)
MAMTSPTDNQSASPGSAIRAEKARGDPRNPVSLFEGTDRIAADYASYLRDESRLAGGAADRLVFPRNESEIAAFLSEMNGRAVPVTVSGGRTGIVGGAVPRGGGLLSLEKMDRLLDLGRDRGTGAWFIRAQAGILLKTLHHRIETKDLAELAASPSLSDGGALQEFLSSAERFFYPVDATETSATLGGTIAANASGERSYRYGPTRKYVRSLRVVLADGSVLSLRRGKTTAGQDGRFQIVTTGGKTLVLDVPRYRMPSVKSSAGYFAAEGMDLIDLFIGSEGTLGVITEAEMGILPRPENILSLVPFFPSEEDALEFFREAKAAFPDALVFEYFDSSSLAILREKKAADGAGSPLPPISEAARAAIFFELPYTEATLDGLILSLDEILQRHRSSTDQTWTGMEDEEREKVRLFRHALPEAVNAIVAANQRSFPAVHKMSTDLAVPESKLSEMLACYSEKLRSAGLPHAVFGHIGENHLHVNMLPRNEDELARAKSLAREFSQKAVSLGGTVSAEHGIGKLKHPYLEILYGKPGLEEMARVKAALDPRGILGRGNIFPESYLSPLRL